MFFGADRFHLIAKCLGKKNIDMLYVILMYMLGIQCFSCSVGTEWPLPYLDSKL